MVHEDWQHHPMVARAIRNNPGDALGILGELHDMCTELEDRYPGLGFAEILSQGAEVEASDQARLQALVSQAYALAEAGMSQRAIARSLGAVSRTTVNRWLQGQLPPGCSTPDGARVPGRAVPKYLQVAEYAKTHSTAETVEEFGCTPQYVSHCRHKAATK